ncbi:MAG TPA: serine protease [Burkholderiales bacterium]|nr:serine protease [Burkholderiales bacterium]
MTGQVLRASFALLRVLALSAPVALGLPSLRAQGELTATVRSGSGFAISRATQIVTNAHVVENCRELRVFAGKRQAPATVIAVDHEADLALLDTRLAVPGMLALRGGPELRLGEGVIVFGFPLASSLSHEGNLTTGNVSALAGLRDDPNYIQITAPVQPGNSGGPVLDQGGTVIGVVTAKLDALSVARFTGDIPQNVNFAVKLESLKRFLDAHRVGYDTVLSGPSLPAADVAQAAKAASVRIQCTSSDTTTAGGEPVHASPGAEPAAPLPVPAPGAVAPGRPMPLPPAPGQKPASEQIQLLEVRTPYPAAAPAVRELVLVNRSPYSVLEVTLGWSEGSGAAHCPSSPAAYRGTQELFVSLAPGQTTTAIGEFSPRASVFCVLAAQFLPPSR